MGIILWFIMGGIVGWIASMIVGTNARQGIMPPDGFICCKGHNNNLSPGSLMLKWL